ncbi:hypothetical protein TELCIR_12223 [Teladorsagia circumcincta]|uniref:Uncharacterized protein n=1 Tax=Teladorsagia circumcincta TaxID=45464 RepID=A0A2G9U745_TELCI|nr:hypothetical protein TELCIR_12223 [Teladorsagia circumcincta]
MTTGGVFQNFVSQMKDKRDEANERNRKREVEKKAAKEAARENLLSPIDADRLERRGSPSRPLFSRYRKEQRDAEKRPAWKF